MLARRPAAFILICVSIPVCSGLLVACSPNPFERDGGDYARRIALERLRSIAPATLDQYKTTTESHVTAPTAESLKARFEGPESRSISLEEARASALANNLDLRVAIIEPAIAAQRVTEEDARFETAFTLRANYIDSQAPTASSLSSAEFKSFSVTPGVRYKTRTGGTLDITLPSSRDETNNSFTFLNPAYENDLVFSLSHPLLRGAGRRVNTAAIRIAGYEEQAAGSRAKLEVMRQLTNVDRAYWLLSQARSELDVRQQQLGLAQAQLDRSRRRVDAGAASDIEVVRAEEGVAQRIEAIIVAQNAVLLRQREFKRVANMDGLSVESPTMVLPATPPDPVQFEFDTPALITHALDNRMELIELELRLAADAAQQGVDRNALLPLVNLTYSYRFNGLGDDVGTSLEEVYETRYPEWTLGIDAELPWGNEAARARLRQTMLRRVADMATRDSRELTIRQEVLNAIDQIDTTWQRILAARQSVVASTRTFQGEQRQFEVGRATSTDVLDAATRLAEAQLAEARALADYQIAQVDLAFATGTLLGADKVSWDSVPAPSIDQPDPAEELPARLTTPADAPHHDTE
ncbi:MAG TPA: TolC family protein [Phycisphaerales bacterium]|nr:TolC family protein [Phycisphaerales bacterium]